MNITSTTLFLEPQSPLVFRSGRPFGTADTGGGGEGFDFPIPATIAGAVRATYADAVDWDFSPPVSSETLMQHVGLAGVLLASFSLTPSAEKDKFCAYFPKPADAVYLGDRGYKSLRRLAPQLSEAQAADTGCDLPEGLHPVMLDVGEKGKPVSGPEFWSSQSIEAWLGPHGPSKSSQVNALGVPRPPLARRSHVVVEGERLAGVDGGLFQSGGIDFGPRRAHGKVHRYDQFGLLVNVLVRQTEAKHDEFKNPLDGAIGRVGADGRLARYVSAEGAWPECPDDLAKALCEIKKGDLLRLMLATPAVFKEGWRPDWLLGSNTTDQAWYGAPPDLQEKGWRFRLMAAAIERYLPYSGWSMRGEHRGARAIRRMVPAGTVYWLQVETVGSSALSDAWLRSVCDASYARDGFGFALWGVGRAHSA